MLHEISFGSFRNRQRSIIKKLKDQEGDEVISKQERLISLPNEDRGLTIFETVSSPVKAMNEIGNDS